MYNEAEKQSNLFSQSHTVHNTPYHATSYPWPRGRTHRHTHRQTHKQTQTDRHTDTHTDRHTHTHIHRQTHTHLHRSDFKKPGARRPGLTTTLIVWSYLDLPEANGSVSLLLIISRYHFCIIPLSPEWIQHGAFGGNLRVYNFIIEHSHN